MTEREFAVEVVRTLQQAGFAALWAGGCVRDELLGIIPEDYDVATSARPEQLRPLFQRRNEIGASFGVVQVIGPRADDGEWCTIEVASFRSDGLYTDGRRPDSVVFSSPEADAKRRDFTINGMFFDPMKGELIDFVGGRADLDARILRAIGDAAARFTEDKLRILRAVRIAARFELAIDPATLAAAQRMAAQICVVSPERIAEELRKLLVHPNRGRGVRLLNEFGLVEPILPELAALGAQVWERVVNVIDALETATFSLVLAAILHPLDKAKVEAIADRLRLSGAEKARVVWLVDKQNELNDAPAMRLSRLKTMLVQHGIEELLALCRAMGKRPDAVDFCERMLRDTPREELDPPPLLTGEDLIAAGLTPGPQFKRLLDAVREAQLDLIVKTSEEAMNLVRDLLA